MGTFPLAQAQAFPVGEGFIDGDSCVLALGDNIFYGNGLRRHLQGTRKNERGATVFGCYVEDPGRFGVVEFGGDGRSR